MDLICLSLMHRRALRKCPFSRLLRRPLPTTMSLILPYPLNVSMPQNLVMSQHRRPPLPPPLPLCTPNLRILYR